jgi:hypothetical protein
MTLSVNTFLLLPCAASAAADDSKRPIVAHSGPNEVELSSSYMAGVIDLQQENEIDDVRFVCQIAATPTCGTAKLR